MTFSLLFTFLSFLCIGWLTSHYAEKRGRHPITWFFIGILFGLCGFLLLFLLPSSIKKEETVVKKKIEPVLSDSLEPFKKENIAFCTSKEWFFLDQTHKQHGPIGFHILKAKWGEKTINSLTYVWSEGMDKWKKIQEMPDIQQFISN